MNETGNNINFTKTIGDEVFNLERTQTVGGVVWCFTAKRKGVEHTRKAKQNLSKELRQFFNVPK